MVTGIAKTYVPGKAAFKVEFSFTPLCSFGIFLPLPTCCRYCIVPLSGYCGEKMAATSGCCHGFLPRPFSLTLPLVNATSQAQWRRNILVVRMLWKGGALPLLLNFRTGFN